MPEHRTTHDLIVRADALHRRISADQRELLRVIASIDRRGAWRDAGARDMAAWVSMRYGISHWKASRWVAAAHALEDLPRLSDALASGDLGLDKAVELTRFATPDTEARLISWAQRVSAGAIRHRGDLVMARPLEEITDVEESRSVWWWYYDEGKRFGLEADLPAAQGARVARALDHLARTLPVMPGEEHPWFARARRADALVAVCTGTTWGDPDPDRATVVVHAQLEGLLSGTGGCQIEEGPVIHPETARRLLCHGRLLTIIEDGSGQVLGVGRSTREPSAWMMRQLRYRDYGCVFPGCGARRFTQAHHIVWWSHGGPTDLDNLVLVCLFHHRLVHEYGWSLRRLPDGVVEWFHPDGTRYRAGPAPPPGQALRREPVLAVVGACPPSIA